MPVSLIQGCQIKPSALRLFSLVVSLSLQNANDSLLEQTLKGIDNVVETEPTSKATRFTRGTLPLASLTVEMRKPLHFCIRGRNLCCSVLVQLSKSALFLCYFCLGTGILVTISLVSVLGFTHCYLYWAATVGKKFIL